jgi:AbrB family looped-hinge helix DNA binding protein
MLKNKTNLREKEIVRIRENYQVTIPNNLRRLIDLGVGDYVEIDLKENYLTVKPVKVVSPDQQYFYTKEWQKKEAEADKDIAAGRVEGPFKNVKDFLKALKKK